MTTSTELNNLAQALVKFHEICPPIVKDAVNPFLKNKYASLEGILSTIKEPLVKCGLAIIQLPEGEYGLSTRLIHVSGEWVESSYSMKPVKDTPQDRGGAITYQRRYAIGAILSLQIDSDDDGNAASGTGAPARATKLPNIPAEVFADLAEESKKGNKKAIEDAKKKYTITDAQLTALRAVFNKPALQNN